jgi:ABC-2 type transport system permease protein
MTAVWTIAKREVLSFFVSPIAYVVLTVWLLISGGWFYFLAQAFAMQPPTGSATANPLNAFFGGTTLFYLPLLVFAPILTMRLLAEERHTGTLEPLLTAPVTEVAVVLGKYLAALLFWVALWAPTLFYVWISSQTGEGVIDPGTIGATYVGILGIGAYYMAIGLLMSALARNQIVAAVLTFLVLGGLFVLGLAEFLDLGETQRMIFSHISLWSHMEAFSKGIVDTRYLVFDLSLAAAAVFLSVRALQAHRWQ